MANENVKIIRLQKTITDLTADNSVLSNGQQVFVTGITDSVNIVTKLGDGSTLFNSIPFFDTIKIETGSAYDVTQAFLSIDGNEIEITATSDIVVTTDTDPIDMISGQTIRLRRISGTWVTLAAGGAGAQVAGTLGETIGANTLVYFNTLGNLMIGDNRYLSQSVLAGFLVKAGVLNDNRLVQSGGILDGFTGLSIGTQYYLGHSGSLLTSAAIAFNEYIVSVGVAVSATEIDVAIRLPEPVRNQDDSVPIGAIQSFATYKDRTGQGYRAFDYDNALSQANFPILFTEIGHKFNQAHVDVGDTDLSASTTLFYPTPPPSTYNRAGIPDISLSSTDFADDGGGKIIVNHGITALLGDNDGRTGTAFKFYEDSGSTLPTGITEGTTYYLMFDATTTYFQISTAEEYAIGGTNRISYVDSGSGTFRLTQEGIALDDAMQQITGEIIIQQTAPASGVGALVVGAAGALLRPSNGTSGTNSLIFDSASSPGSRTSNETRSKTSILFYYIKAENVLTAGEPLSALRYDTGWVANSLWNGQNILITHNLNCDISLLNIKLFLSPTGSDTDALEPSLMTRVFDQATASDLNIVRGITFRGNSVNSLYFDTGADGIYYIDSTGGVGGLVDTIAYYYKVVVTKPNLITTVSDISAGPKVVDLTAADVTYTLPTGIGNGFVQDIFWSNGGTYKLTHATSDLSTVGGLTAGTWIGKGEGNMTVIYDSANNDWKVRAYDDSGSNSAGVWKKEKDGILSEFGIASITIPAIVAGASAVISIAVFPIAFISEASISIELNIPYGEFYSHKVPEGDTNISSFNLALKNVSSTDVAEVTGQCYWYAKGYYR